MKSFAVFLDHNNITCSSMDEGNIKVYSFDPENNAWYATQNIEFSLLDCTSIAGIRKKILDMIHALGECRVFIGSEVTGQLYSILEAHRFNIYEVNGEPEQFLSSVLELENKNGEIPAETSGSSRRIYPEKAGEEGAYFLNLKAALSNNPELSSKKILLPFIDEKKFKKIEVLCDHIPRWLNSELEKSGMKFDVCKIDTGDSKVTIFNR